MKKFYNFSGDTPIEITNLKEIVQRYGVKEEASNEPPMTLKQLYDFLGEIIETNPNLADKKIVVKNEIFGSSCEIAEIYDEDDGVEICLYPPNMIPEQIFETVADSAEGIIRCMLTYEIGIEE